VRFHSTPSSSGVQGEEKKSFHQVPKPKCNEGRAPRKLPIRLQTFLFLVGHNPSSETRNEQMETYPLALWLPKLALHEQPQFRPRATASKRKASPSSSPFRNDSLTTTSRVTRLNLNDAETCAHLEADDLFP
jgi:hypothetical protein